MEIIRLAETTSTNSALKEIADAPHATVLVTDCQTAGRGQRGNSWEAQPGCNLTFSIMLRAAALAARNQFAVSCAVALGVVDMLKSLLPDRNDITVKWPNDIYVGDRKICGILIENSLSGNLIASSVAGVGINVNQRRFYSDAPNPVSLFQLTNRQYPLEKLLEDVCRRIISYFDKYVACDESGRFTALFELYKASLWRREGTYKYRDNLYDEEITATFLDIQPSGHIILRLLDGTTRTFAFKQLTHLP